ncbi:VOC family protein [Jannaschia sp. LMIT008]|uniref:VOC family protein n=1 Tax=Jannaschia maritima TaxID=3032585 RepID=UPI002810F741|nr:VOC family protein [Jannaschia sp. LMIT008]
MIRGLNHVTLAVSDLDRSLAFYRDVLGLRVAADWPTGAYLEAGTLWLCLSVDDAARDRPHPDYTHMAFDVGAGDFEALRDRVAMHAAPWRENRSEGASFYFLDPDGHRLEIHVGTLATRLDRYRRDPPPGMRLHD